MSDVSDAENGGKAAMNLDGLADEWEKEVDLRTFLRDANGKDDGSATLFTDSFQVNVKNTCIPHVFALMRPLTLRRAVTPCQPGPHVAPLREQVGLLYKKLSIAVGEDQVVLDAWFIRKLCAFIKMKVRKSDVSTVPCPEGSCYFLVARELHA